MIEIERKFLVSSDQFKMHATSQNNIVQGFLNTDPERTVRIRIEGGSAFLTVKGKSDKAGISRFEWEKNISIAEAEALLKLCEPGVIEKRRYLVRSGRHLFEVDVFDGENDGLTVAEIELQSENEPFERPEWLGIEVTGDLKYYNSQLSKKPFSLWNEP